LDNLKINQLNELKKYGQVNLINELLLQPGNKK